MNPLSALTTPPLVRIHGPGGHVTDDHAPARVIFLTSHAEHVGKTFLGLKMCALFDDILPVEADNGARGEHDFGSIPGMEPVDFGHHEPSRRLREILQAPVNRKKTLLVDNANHADPDKLARIIAQITPLARATVLLVMEEGRPKFKGYLTELRNAIGRNADWLICRNHFRSEANRFLDEEDWRQSAEREAYRRTGGAEMILPKLHPRLSPISYYLNSRLYADRRPPQAEGVWLYDRNRIQTYQDRLHKTLLDYQNILLTLPQIVAA